MRRIGLAAIVLLGLLAAPDVRGAEPDPVAPCTERSWTGGTTEWCIGSLVYRDYAYDDNGADTEQGSPHGTSLNRATGDVDHRDHGQALNSADLLALRLWASDDMLHVRFDLNTLFPGDDTVGVLAIDTDNDDETGSTTLGDFGVRAPGIDQLYTFDDRDAEPDDPYLGGIIRGSVPMPAAPGAEWDIYAFTALGDGTVMNVAFRGTESGGWWEADQGAALASGDISSFKGEVTVADLVARTRHRKAGVREGLIERVYRSEFAIGDDQEGVDYDEGHPGRNGSGQFAQYFQYLGHFQPYAAFVPRISAPPYGIQLALHGYSGGHASLVANEGMQQQLGEDLDRIVLVPLGRGPAGYYSDWSERDVLDVVADVKATYPIDHDRVFSGGYSMGGYGAFRFAALYPDVFAGAISWVGFTGDCMNGTPFGANDPCPTGAVGNVLKYFDNLRHVPTANVYAAADELVHVHTGNAVRERFAALGYPHIFWMHAAEHLTFAVLDDWAKEAAWTADLRRVHDPARVTYRTDPTLGNAVLGIVHDRAYWIAGIRTAKPGDGVVDLTSHACDARMERKRTLTNGAGPAPVPWVSQEAIDAGPATIKSGPYLTGTLSNVRSLVLDVGSPCFAADVSRVKTDTKAVIEFSDGRQPVTLTP